MFMRTFSSITAVIALLALTGCTEDTPAQDYPGTKTTQEEAGYFAVLGDNASVDFDDNEVTPQSGIVLIPSGSLEVAKVGTTDNLDDAQQYPIIPAKGEIFYVAQVDVQYGSPDMKPEVSVDVNGDSRPLELTDFSAQTIIVSAPEDSEITLHVLFEGIDQTVDFATGERTSEDIPALYTGSSSFASDGTLVTYKTSGVYGDVTLEGQIDDVQRIAWDSNLGWADEGQSAWLVLDAPLTWKYESSSRGVKAENIDANWVFTDEQGTEYLVSAEKDKLPVIKVPATTLQFDASIRGNGQTYDGNQPEAVVTGQTSTTEVFF